MKNLLNFFDKRSLSEDELTQSRIRSIERKINLLLVIVIVQTFLITFVAFSTFSEWVMPSWTTIILCSLVALAGVYVFRRQIPGWIGAAGRYAFGRSRKKEESAADKNELPEQQNKTA